MDLERPTGPSVDSSSASYQLRDLEEVILAEHLCAVVPSGVKRDDNRVVRRTK